MFVIGLSSVKYQNIVYEKQYNLSEINGKAVVISEPKETKYRTKYTIKIQNKKYILVLNKSSSKLEYGDLIKISGKYEKPQVARNFKGFDYSIYLKSKHIYGTIKGENVETLGKHYTNAIFNILNQFRNTIINNSKQIIKDESAAGLLIGILIGDTDYIDQETEENFKNSSLAHILAVSGQHISYVILAISFALKISKLGKRLSNILSILLLFLFIILTQMTPSVVRAGIMGMLIITSKLLHRKADIYTNLAISLIFILLLNPFAVYDVGLWLSYSGTLGIVLLNKKIISKLENSNNIFEFIKNTLAMTLSAQIFIFPIMILNFNKFSTMFWLSNILASPLVGISIIYGFLMIFVSLISIKITVILAIPLKFLLNILIFISEKVSSLNFSIFLVITINPLFMIIYYFIIFLIIYKKVLKKHLIEKKIIKFIKFFLILILIISLIFQFLDFNNNELEIHFVDVGQGDCCLIITPNKKKILIDGGGSEGYDVGKNVLLPYLLDRGIMSLDYVIISHFDTDHVGGILTILEELKVGKVIISKQAEESANYKKFQQIVKKKKISVLDVGAGVLYDPPKIQIEKDLYFEILWPDNSKLITENALNNNSIVCKLHYNNFSMLFTGDIEEIAEKEILKKYKNNLKVFNSTILKVGHHGSKTSSTQEFIGIVNPKIALIGVGENNKFGHPNDGVIERLENLRYKNIPHRQNGRNNNNYK